MPVAIMWVGVPREKCLSGNKTEKNCIQGHESLFPPSHEGTEVGLSLPERAISYVLRTLPPYGYRKWGWKVVGGKKGGGNTTFQTPAALGVVAHQRQQLHRAEPLTEAQGRWIGCVEGKEDARPLGREARAGKRNFQSTQRRVGRRALMWVEDRGAGPVTRGSRGGREGGWESDWRIGGWTDMRFSSQDHDNEGESHRHGKRCEGVNEFFIFCVMYC